MSAVALAAALLLVGGAQTQQLVQGIEKLAQGESAQGGLGERLIKRLVGGLAGQLFDFQVTRGPGNGTAQGAPSAGERDDSDKSDDDADTDDADTDDDAEIHVNVESLDGGGVSIGIGPRVPKPPRPPVPPTLPPLPAASDSPEGHRATITEHARGASSVELLHDIASAAGWSLTLVGVGRDKIDVDFEDLEPAEALRRVLLQANCMGVLRGDKLAVIPGTQGHSAGLLVEQRGGGGDSSRGRAGKHSGDLVKVGGDLVVTSGTVVEGDAVAVLGSVEVEPGAVVQGSAAAIGGSVEVRPGGVVLGDSVALLGENAVEHGGQVLGDHVQVGLGRLFSDAPVRHRSFVSRIGPFGLFPTLALFAVVYLVGLCALRLWPERMRAMGGTLLETPLRSFVIGFLLWLLFVPVLILLVVSVVGMLLVPLLPLAVALSVMLGACALALKIGEALPAGEGQRFVPPAALGMGLTAMLLVSLVPWVGAPLLVLVLFVAPGAVIGSRFGRALN